MVAWLQGACTTCAAGGAAQLGRTLLGGGRVCQPWIYQSCITPVGGNLGRTGCKPVLFNLQARARTSTLRGKRSKRSISAAIQLIDRRKQARRHQTQFPAAGAATACGRSALVVDPSVALPCRLCQAQQQQSGDGSRRQLESCSRWLRGPCSSCRASGRRSARCVVLLPALLCPPVHLLHKEVHARSSRWPT